MTHEPSTFKVAIACGTAGAFVDVSQYLKADAGISRSWGRQDPFRATPPGLFSLALVNADGRFTPDSTNGILATPLTEGMEVAWEIGGRLRHGTIRTFGIGFDQDTPEGSFVRINCDDGLGECGRAKSKSLLDGMIRAARPSGYWPFTDTRGSSTAAEVSGLPGFRPIVGTIEFGVTGPDIVGGTQAELTAAAGAQSRYTSDRGDSIYDPAFNPYYGNSSASHPGLSFLITPMNETSFFEIVSDWIMGFKIGIQNTNIVLWTQAGSYVTVLAGLIAQRTYFIRMDGPELYIDGNLVYTYGLPVTWSGKQPPLITVGGVGYGESKVRISHLASASINGEYAAETTIANRLTAIFSTLSTITADTLPAELSQHPIGPQPRQSALDAINMLMLSEQGHVYTETTGTLTAPVEKIKIRDRARPTTVTSTWSTSADIVGSPVLDRSIENANSTQSVNGPTTSVEVTDDALAAKIGASNGEDNVLYLSQSHLLTWGQDRQARGIPSGLGIKSVTIDAYGTDADRWDELLDMVPGDRHRIEDLPLSQLGYTSWDGWVIGGSEFHDGVRSLFTIFFEPSPASPAKFDTAKFRANGALTVTSTINAAVASMSVSTTGPKFTTTGLPIDIIIDSEQLTVTACTTATPQVMTVTRGVNGTAAASHTAGALVELAQSSNFAY